MEFQDLLTEAGIAYHMGSGHQHSREGWVQFDCPFCGRGSGSLHMGFNLEKQFCNCWRCGSHSLYQVIRELMPTDANPGLLVKSLRSSSEPRRGTEKRPRFRRHETRVPAILSDLRRSHGDYLRNRGFQPPDLIKLWRIRGIGMDPKWGWRIWIPIYQEGRLVTWTTRAIGEKNLPKYRSASPDDEVVPIKQTLYGEDYCRHAVVICEGPIDVWRIGPGAVAIYGATPSSTQVSRILRYPVRAVCFDREVQAQQNARELVDRISCFPGETYNIILDSNDPGEASQEEVQVIRKVLGD